MNVRVAVALELSVSVLLAIETVGSVASIVITAVLAAAVLVLPAASVWRTLMSPAA